MGLVKQFQLEEAEREYAERMREIEEAYPGEDPELLEALWWAEDKDD